MALYLHARWLSRRKTVLGPVVRCNCSLTACWSDVHIKGNASSESVGLSGMVLHTSGQGRRCGLNGLLPSF